MSTPELVELADGGVAAFFDEAGKMVEAGDPTARRAIINYEDGRMYHAVLSQSSSDAPPRSRGFSRRAPAENA